tara:strand:- start:561 stop:815 length:255 start_codon:yes stop_codon:yes gene_type:complete
MLAEIIKSKLSENLNIDSLDIIDESHKHANHAQSSGGHFRVRIVSEDFQDKSLIERHRMIYGILGDMLKNEIHALSIDARSLNE